MEFLLNRYRNLSVLLLVIFSQLLLIAYQVKTSKDVPLLKVWAVTAVTPVERGLEFARRNTWGFVEDYFVLIHTRQENDRLRTEVGKLKLDNQFLRTELSTAERVQALSVFQSHTPSKMLAARIIGNGTGANSKAVFIDRGIGSGVESGMAVVTPDGILGKVAAAYPTASLVLLITDANFAAGVISQKNHVRGTLKGQGHDGAVLVDYIQNEEKVDTGEWFFTSGDDRIFPKGFPVGQVTSVKNGQKAKEIYVAPSGFQNGLEEVLVVLDAVHQPIPEGEYVGSTYHLTPGPADASPGQTAAQIPAPLATDADRLSDQYREAGQAQHHLIGDPASYTAPDFSKVPGIREPKPPAQASPVLPPAGTKPTTGAPLTATGNQVAPASSGGAAANTFVSGAPARSAVPVAAKPGGNPAAADPSAVAVKPRAKSSTPLLVTDPTDADPSEPVIAAPPKRPESDLDEFGQPRSARPAAKTKPKTEQPRPAVP